MTGQPITSTRAMIVISMVVLAVLLLASSVQALSGDAPADVETASHVVAGGDSLWSIAEDLTVPGGDVRYTLAEIRRLNDLDDSTIRAGEVLAVPRG